MKSAIFLLLFICLIQPSSAQTDTGYTTFLLNRLAQLQVKRDPVFLVGSYPSYINNKQRFKKKKKDITIFYNILIDATLKELRPQLNVDQQKIVDTLLLRSANIYHRFKNERRGTYNFWLRDSAYRFPYSWWIPLIKKNGNVPDDMDDTSLSQLVHPSDSLEKLHQIMQKFIHFPSEKMRTTDKKYRSYPAYSSWFGERFPVVFDVAVLSNILTFVQHYNLKWTAADTASLQLIVQSIKNKEYITHPLRVSPYYGKTSILLYHFSRLMQVKKIPALDSLRPRLVEECRKLWGNADNILEKIILANALQQLGAAMPPINIPSRKQLSQQIEQNDFPFFIGNIPSYLPNGLKKFFTKLHLLLYYHYCPAYNDVLLLEYLVNQENAKSRKVR